MTQPMTPREKVEDALRKHIKVDAAGLTPAVISHHIFGFQEAADAILAVLASDDLTPECAPKLSPTSVADTTLASGSGDHADHSGDVTNMVDHDGLADLRHCIAIASSAQPGWSDVWTAALEALLAENAALRAELAAYRTASDLEARSSDEAERKLAEAMGLLDGLSSASARACNLAGSGRATREGIREILREPNDQARTFLSSTEAERG